MHLLRLENPGSSEHDQAVVDQNSGSGIQISVQTGGFEMLESWSQLWTELCQETPGAFPFERPEIVLSYVKAFAPASLLVVIMARSQGRLKALLPLIKERAWFCGVPVSRLRGAANVHSAYFGLPCLPNSEDEYLSAMADSLKGMPGWDLLELPYVREGTVLERFAHAASRQGLLTGFWKAFETLFIPLEPAAAEPQPRLRNTSKRFRSRLVKRRRKLEEEHALSLRCVDRPDRATLLRFYEVEASGWKGRAGTAILRDQEARNFYDELARRTGESGYFRIYFLLADGEVVAGQMGLVYGRRFYLLKAAYEERFRSSGPGHLLLDEVLRSCTAEGLEELDFVGPAARDEAEWTSANRQCGFWYIFPDRILGKILHRAKFKLAPLLKRPLQKFREL